MFWLNTFLFRHISHITPCKFDLNIYHKITLCVCVYVCVNYLLTELSDYLWFFFSANLILGRYHFFITGCKLNFKSYETLVYLLRLSIVVLQFFLYINEMYLHHHLITLTLLGWVPHIRVFILKYYCYFSFWHLFHRVLKTGWWIYHTLSQLKDPCNHHLNHAFEPIIKTCKFTQLNYSLKIPATIT